MMTIETTYSNINYSHGHHHVGDFVNAPSDDIQTHNYGHGEGECEGDCFGISKICDFRYYMVIARGIGCGKGMRCGDSSGLGGSEGYGEDCGSSIIAYAR